MVQVYADNVLVYDPFAENMELQELKVTVGLNKAGTAEICLPPDHPAYNSFVRMRTIVTVYRRGDLIFRGRPLYPKNDFDNFRTITCEGERGFLRDGVMRPYLYQTDPASIFRKAIGIYNEQVDKFKQFVVGDITVTDQNSYIRLENESASQVSDVIDTLVERVGGYIVFTSDADGSRVINWLATLDQQSTQTVEFGENLLDFSSTGANAEIATAIVPYGAKDETTGKPITIESVNGGKDYIQDDEAVALRGFIAVPVTWDDVTLPENLLTKARQYLNLSKLAVTTLEVFAVDLSAVDRDIDTFRVGDNVLIYSTPHGLHGEFLLRERTYDLLDPSQDKVVFGEEIATLTGADVRGDRTAQSLIHRTGLSITAGYIATKNELKTILAPKISAEGQYLTSDGLLMQWGTLQLAVPMASSLIMSTATYKQAYSGIPAVCVTPQVADPTGLYVGVKASNSSGFSVVVNSPAIGTVTINWFAVGKSA